MLGEDVWEPDASERSRHLERSGLAEDSEGTLEAAEPGEEASERPRHLDRSGLVGDSSEYALEGDAGYEGVLSE